ncbi:hypothetical protein DFH09DRAFT_1285156 [Mycena vulgaris]|nr:hypothetical protein DFH09DRAFT_1285156 [Mycena vulgaris]
MDLSPLSVILSTIRDDLNSVSTRRSAGSRLQVRAIFNLLSAVKAPQTSFPVQFGVESSELDFARAPEWYSISESMLRRSRKAPLRLISPAIALGIIPEDSGISLGNDVIPNSLPPKSYRLASVSTLHPRSRRSGRTSRSSPTRYFSFDDPKSYSPRCFLLPRRFLAPRIFDQDLALVQEHIGIVTPNPSDDEDEDSEFWHSLAEDVWLADGEEVTEVAASASEIARCKELVKNGRHDEEDAPWDVDKSMPVAQGLTTT